MLSLFLCGILNLSETLSGFSNPTVVMIASLFIIGEGLSQTGWTALAGKKLIELAGKSVGSVVAGKIAGSEASGVGSVVGSEGRSVRSEAMFALSDTGGGIGEFEKMTMVGKERRI